jgi:hypothetical protein
MNKGDFMKNKTKIKDQMEFSVPTDIEERFEIMLVGENGEETPANTATGLLRNQNDKNKELSEGRKNKAISDSMKILNKM